MINLEIYQNMKQKCVKLLVVEITGKDTNIFERKFGKDTNNFKNGYEENDGLRYKNKIDFLKEIFGGRTIDDLPGLTSSGNPCKRIWASEYWAYKVDETTYRIAFWPAPYDPLKKKQDEIVENLQKLTGEGLSIKAFDVHTRNPFRADPSLENLLEKTCWNKYDSGYSLLWEEKYDPLYTKTNNG